MSRMNSYWTFMVYAPPEDDNDEACEYEETQYGLTLEDAKERFKEDNPEFIVLAGGGLAGEV